MRRDRHPESSILPPPDVMRTAIGMTIPFGIGWAICGSILWQIVLDQYATSMPARALSGYLSLGLVVVYGLFGALVAVALRVFLWLLLQRRPRRPEPRDVPVRRDIRVGQDWREI